MEAASASAAWAALYSVGGRPSHCSGGRVLTGGQAFGIAHPRVTALLQQLPDADRCERYCGWSEGRERPPPPPLVLLARDSVRLSSQRCS